MQPQLYANRLKRIDLLNLSEQNNGKKIVISVHRNHSFEMVASVLNAFLTETALKAEFTYSDYDDSFNFQNYDADIHIIWIDVARYKNANVADFIKERVSVLRSKTVKPIFVLYTGAKNNSLENMTTDCYAISIEDLVDNRDINIYDPDKEPISGTRLSGPACLYIARQIGLRYIPAVMLPGIKAIVVDLDNTLYSGVLGEDGIEKLIPNLELQQQLKNLKQQGLFLTIASKNEEADAIEMFEKRTDFILKWSDFTTTKINWDSKYDNILKIAKTLNIGTDAILFIDDNPAEIQNVKPTGVKTLLANADAVNILRYMPGLLKLKHSNEDALRAKDVQANEERARLAQTLTPAEYFKKLGIKLSYHINDKNQIVRIAELLGKTNQFILNYARCNESQVNDMMCDENHCVITIKMSDNLSDSGVIAILLAHTDNGLVLDELTVSCRALGRNLENIMLPYIFQLAANTLRTDNKISIEYKRGPRNGPALNWLQNIAATDISDDQGTIKYVIPDDIDTTGIEIEIQ